jgi:hypothetical protein
MAQLDTRRIRPEQRQAVEERAMRNFISPYLQLPGVRKYWTYQGRVYMPVAKGCLPQFAMSLNPSTFKEQFNVFKRGDESVVYVSREVISPYVQQILEAKDHYIQAEDRIINIRDIEAARYENLTKLLSTEQRLFEGELKGGKKRALLRSLYIDSPKEAVMSEVDGKVKVYVEEAEDGYDEESLSIEDIDCISTSDDDKLDIADALDTCGRVKHAPGKPVEGLTYSEDFYQRPQDINRKMGEWTWKHVCPNAPEGRYDDE